MKKKLFLVFVLMLTLACTNVKTQKKEVVDSEFIPQSIKNVNVEEMVNKIKITWELEDEKNYKEILMTKVGTDRLRELEKIDPMQKEYLIEAKPIMKMKFIIKTKAKNGKTSEAVTVIAAAKQKHSLVKVNEYIDIDSETIKFLFKTNPEANVKVYIGEEIDNLTLKKEQNKYDNEKGIKIKGLEKNKKYYYKVVSEQNGSVIESKIFVLNKIEKERKKLSPQWAREAIFYEIPVRTFYDGDGDGIGDFKGLSEKLDYIKDLGVDALWLMPCFDSRSYHGYDTADFYKIEPDMGKMDDFENFIKEAHKRDIKVILDYVVNHCSVEHAMFQSVVNDKKSKYKDYFVWNDPFTNLNQKGEWSQVMWHKLGNEYFHAIFWEGLPDFNFSNYEVRNEMKNIAKFWLEKGVDGFRLDASKHIDDFSKENTMAWWLEFDNYIKDINPNAFIVGENWVEDSSYIAQYFGVMDSSFDFSLRTIILDTLKGRNADISMHMEEIEKLFSKVNENYINTTFLGNHDTNRVSAELKNDINKMKLAASILLTLPGTPFIYYGDELGQYGKKPDENIREPFDWYKSAKGEGMTTMEKGGFYETMKYTFGDDGISLEEEKNNSESIYNHYKEMIKIRKDNPEIIDGKYSKLDTEDGVLSYIIEKNGKSLIVIHEISGLKKEIDLTKIGKEFKIIKANQNENNIYKLNSYDTLIIEKLN